MRRARLALAAAVLSVVAILPAAPAQASHACALEGEVNTACEYAPHDPIGYLNYLLCKYVLPTC